MNTMSVSAVNGVQCASMSTGEYEAKFAAEWWADQFERTTPPGPTPGQLTVFKRTVERLIRQRIARDPRWATATEQTDPQLDALCTVAMDHRPDDILTAALAAANLPALILPRQTIMWINPGRVTAAKGDGAPIESVYTLHRARSTPSE